MGIALIIVYFATLGVLALFGAYRLVLTLWAVRVKAAPAPAVDLPPDVPKLVVQLPIYNEAFVVERLLRSVAALSYPEGRLEIQVLDDSTDETSKIAHRVVNELTKRGVPIKVVRRAGRAGYKAGALAYGLTETDAELVAIFDADFVPEPDFLLRTVPLLLADDNHGLVQARWAHNNRTSSWLTRAQAIFLDGHFSIEHRARAAAGHFFNFNGTAGVWRRRAIEAAGGWRSDTITEDLDLSYRAQLAGFRFVYTDAVTAPAELPESWAAFRSQQARWVRGSMETARLHLRRILSARDLPWLVRIDAAVHLTNNVAYVLMAVLAVLLPACVFLRDQLGWRVPGGQALLSILDITMLTAGTFAMVVFYLAAVRITEGRITPRRVIDVLFALCVGAGMSITNAREVLRGLSSNNSEFVRTPKRGSADNTLVANQYRAAAPHFVSALEAAFGIYFLAGVVYAVYWSLYGALPFLLLYLVGFAAVSVSTWRERLPRDKAAMDALTAHSSS